MSDVTLKYQSRITGFELRGETVIARSEETYSQDGEVIVRQDERGWQVRAADIAGESFTLPSGQTLSGAEFVALAMIVAAAVKAKAEAAIRKTKADNALRAAGFKAPLLQTGEEK